MMLRLGTFWRSLAHFGLNLGLSLALSSCVGAQKTSTDEPVATLVQAESAYVALEAAIDAQNERQAQRDQAYRLSARTCDDGSARYAFIRAASAGRLAEKSGLRGLGLVRESERWARQAWIRDPGYHNGEVQRLLGSLLALAGHHVAGLDVEEGIELLEDLTRRQPDQAVNHLRLAQALQAAGDDESANPSLCQALQRRAQLRASEVRILDELVVQSGGQAAIDCGEKQ